MSFQKSSIWSTIVAIISAAVILTVTVVNVRGLTASVQQRTDSYLRDVSRQSALVIDERFNNRIRTLQLIGNSLAFGSVIDDEEFLNRELLITEFEALAYVREDGSAMLVSKNGTEIVEDAAANYADSQALQETLRGRITAGFYDDYVAFMVPISEAALRGTASQNDAVPKNSVHGVMIGIRTKESLQSLLVNDAFGGAGFTFIIDQYDEILAEPMNEEDYIALSSLVHAQLDSTELRRMLQENASADPEEQSVEYTLQTTNGTTLLFDYEPLELFGWAVVTAVNENFLAEAVNNYVMRIVMTLVVFVIVFLLLLALLLYLQRKYQKRVEAVAFVDALTGGMSFIRFRMLAEPLIEKSDEGSYAIATLNVKRFKLINRIGGSREGDDVLRKIYDVIRRNLNGEDEMVAHSTADNFVLLIRNEGEEEISRRLAKIAREVESLQTVMPVRISEGVYVTADPDVDLIMFLDRSNSARVSATQEYNSTCVFYDDNFVEKQEERLRMIGMIEEGLRDNQFSVYLQPKVSPVTRRIAGSEALVRWNHPTRGMIGPNIFIPLAEQNGLICDLDLYVFDKVCAEIRKWEDAGYDIAPISVNVSGLHLKDVDFVKKYREIADRHGVDPSLIELELTESIMFSGLETIEARGVIDTIHEYGFRCSMDDFGSGYSALGILADLPIDCIKLDRGFFLDFVDNPRAQTVVATIIKLAKELGITTVAEGIEMKKQVELLRDMGVDMIQGFYFSRPLPMNDFEEKVYGDDPTFHGSDD